MQTDKLRFNKNGKFVIMQVADPQDLHFVRHSMIRMLNKAYDDVKPDLVVFAGDNILGNHLKDARFGTKTVVHTKEGEYERMKKAISHICQPLEERKIPFTMIYGNHDDVNRITKEEQADIYRSYSMCVGLDNPDKTVDVDTFNLPVFASEGEKKLFNLWMIDSLTYNRHPEDEKDVAYYENDLEGYACVHKDQIDWYVKKSNELKEANGGEPVPSMVFQHIIVPEIYDVLAKDKDGKWILPEGVDGELWEDPCPPHYSNGQFDAMVAQGDVVAMFFGHDHKNSFEVEYKGVDLVNTPGATFSSYGDHNRGARVIDIKESDTSTYTTEVIRWLEFYDAENNPAAKNEFIVNGNEFSTAEKIEAFFGYIFAKIAEIFSF